MKGGGKRGEAGIIDRWLGKPRSGSGDDGWRGVRSNNSIPDTTSDLTQTRSQVHVDGCKSVLKARR